MQFLLFSKIFCCLLVDLCVKTGTRFSLRDKRIFEISEFEITRVDCVLGMYVMHVRIEIYGVAFQKLWLFVQIYTRAMSSKPAEEATPNTVDSRYLELQGTSEILRDIRTSTYQICRIEQKIIRTTTFSKYIYVIGLLK